MISADWPPQRTLKSTDLQEWMFDENQRGSAVWFDITYKEDRSYVVDRLKKLTEKGVYPSPLW